MNQDQGPAADSRIYANECAPSLPSHEPVLMRSNVDTNLVNHAPHTISARPDPDVILDIHGPPSYDESRSEQHRVLFASPLAEPSNMTLTNRMTAPNMANAFSIRVKAKQIPSHHYYRRSDVMQKYEEAMLVSPAMAFSDFQQAFIKMADTHRNGVDTRPWKAGHKMWFEIHAIWRKRTSVCLKKDFVVVTSVNWPDVVAALKRDAMEKLTVTYFVGPAPQVKYPTNYGCEGLEDMSMPRFFLQAMWECHVPYATQRRLRRDRQRAAAFTDAA